MKFAIYAGHVSANDGATSGGYNERDLNIPISKAVAKRLRDVYGQQTKENYTLGTIQRPAAASRVTQRAKDANAWGADAVVEIHHNSGVASANGTETYYFASSSKGKVLAQSIHNALVKYGYRSRAIKPDTQSNLGRLEIIRSTNAPAVLVEVCFQSSKVDMAMWNADRIGAAIADAIATHYGIKAKKPKEIQVGDIVTFNSGHHYRSASALSPTGSKRSAGKAKVTAISKGAKYPYHLIGEKDGSNVYGWVASKDISQ